MGLTTTHTIMKGLCTMATQDRTVIVGSYPRIGQLKDGANHFKLLLERIRDINDRTCDRLGEGLDGRDYNLIAEELESAVRQHLIDQAGAHKEGFLRAFCDYMSLGADGCGVPRNWDPLKSTATSFSLKGEEA